MDTQESPRSGLAGFLEGHGELLVWGVVLQCLILVPLLLLSQGYLPPDDCLRHAAKAVDGRAWSEILVLRPGILSDPHVAWNGLLRGIHLLTGWGPDGLVALTVAGLFLLVMAAPLYWFKAPEAWLGSWVLLWVAGGSQIRPILGRPFLVPMAALLALMCLWTRGGPVTRRGWALSTALFGAGALLHGAWYLFALVPLAFLVAGRLRDGGVLSGCYALGCLLAALVSGHPVDFLAGQLIHMGHAVAPIANPLLAVPELGPSHGAGFVGVALLAVVLFQVRRGREARLLKDPLFVLVLIGWLLGLFSKRFWIDWSYPCGALWLAFQLEPWFQRLGARAPLRRLTLAAATGLAAILLISTGDEGRWTDRSRDTSFLFRADLQPWLPGAGGILYSPDMTTFFDLYFAKPKAPWRYMVGFEPGMMPPEDLAIFHGILLDPQNPAPYGPWIAKMRPEDRLLLRSSRSPQFLLPGLQWCRAASNLWLGRKTG